MRPTVVLAGDGHHDLAANLLGDTLPKSVPATYVVLRHGRPSARAFIPGHRVPREAGVQGGPLTRPPRRVALSAPAPLLEFVHLVLAPPAPPAPAITAILVDAVRTADGLVYLLDAGGPLPPERRAELAELAAVAGRLVLVDTRTATEAERAAVARQVPAAAGASWHRVDDVAAITAELTAPWFAVDEPRAGHRAASSGLRSEATREDGATEARWPARAEASAASRVTHDDAAWREVLATALAQGRAEVERRFAADVDALVARCTSDPAQLPAVLDIELHALSLQATAALDAAARGLVGAVFSAVVEGRLSEAELVRVTTALGRQIDPDDRTLLITATAGVAAVSGATDALSATGIAPPTLLPPICLAVSGNCHLSWQYRGVPDHVQAGRWLRQAAQAARCSVGEMLDARFAALAEAVEALASDAVDHGVLLA
jgi:hypothetical protein